MGREEESSRWDLPSYQALTDRQLGRDVDESRSGARDFDAEMEGVLTQEHYDWAGRKTDDDKK